MIPYTLHTLSNGLTVIATRDTASEMAALNLLYKVGSRNENPEHTGFAHLFEHLMFRGTRRIPDFDTPLLEACGEDNAFTNNDYTDYYITLPKDNLQTALWLEADRMRGLHITREVLETEKRVVLEEYNQRYVNQPYGDMWQLLRSMCYTAHPYRWAAIGLTPDHIRKASTDDVRNFYARYYTPSNCILSVCANIAPEQIFESVEHWFGSIEDTPHTADIIPQEPAQTEARRTVVKRDVPAASITIAFHMGDRLSRSYYLCDIITDLLAGGSSSRLYQHLVKEGELFGSTNAYITGDVDSGLLAVTGNLMPGVSIEQGETALWNEIDRLKHEPPTDYELTKVKNKFEADMAFGEINIMNKAMNTGYYAMLERMDLLNDETEIFRGITAAEICAETERIFTKSNSSTLIYEI